MTHSERRCCCIVRPSPHGEGGLKCGTLDLETRADVSLPTRGGWIEIVTAASATAVTAVPPHTGRVD